MANNQVKALRRAEQSRAQPKLIVLYCVRVSTTFVCSAADTDTDTSTTLASNKSKLHGARRANFVRVCVREKCGRNSWGSDSDSVSPDPDTDRVRVRVRLTAVAVVNVVVVVVRVDVNQAESSSPS